MLSWARMWGRPPVALVAWSVPEQERGELLEKSVKFAIATMMVLFTCEVLGETVRRETYTFQIDDQKAIDPEDNEIDYDHLTSINISDGSLILISVVDAVSGEEKYIDKAY